MKVLGEMHSELAMQQNIEVHTLWAELGIMRYLIDVTEAQNVDRVIETYEFELLHFI